MGRKRYQIGDVIRGDHRVVAVHRGFLGEVYICRQELPRGRHVYKAIKTFKDGNAVRKRLFDGELAYWVNLPPHPNVVQARDVDTVDNQLILEYVHGPNLKEIAHKRPVHPRHFVHWARGIGAGLYFLHREHEFVHRDLRPANILIDTARDLTAKICDLGIGKPFDPAVLEHTVIGTHLYMAPEVHEARTDFRSDIFSYGATLYFLLTGRYAVKLTTRNSQEIVSPRDLGVRVPESVNELVLRCLERDPQRRYQSMEEVTDALRVVDEWPIVSTSFQFCPEHSYFHYCDERRSGCPFCAFVQAFRAGEKKMARSPEGTEDSTPRS